MREEHRRVRVFAWASPLLVLCGCFPSTEVIPSPGAPTFPPKAEDCAIEFFDNGAPQKPYDELAELHVTPTGSWELPPKEIIRRQACAVGADAVIGLHTISRGLYDYTVVGTAVRYRSTGGAGVREGDPR
jgi:hypothetical protein